MSDYRDQCRELRDAKREAPAPKPIFRDQPLEFSLSSKGLAITGGTNSSRELRAFLKKLEALAALLPEGGA